MRSQDCTKSSFIDQKKNGHAQSRLHEKFIHEPKKNVMRSQDCTKSSFIDFKKKVHAQSRLHEKFIH